ncbi:MAG: MBL fold metallo-hydrolase [Clostridiales bacterium]|jgi:L-ascorbate metabolism protein UlaG (beta-lactamase superfamily)|nr:MBL fold metallo-hydrolase [Clostridiales bacterium]
MLTGKRLIADIKTYQPDPGELAFWWLGQLGYIIKTERLVFAVDAYLDDNQARLIPPLLAPAELSGVNFFIGTHDHSDHIDRKSWPALAAASPDAKFAVPAKIAKTLPEELGIDPLRFIGLDEGVSYADDNLGVSLRALPAAHEFLDRDPDTGLHPSIGVVIECGGMRIFHSGDSCKYDGMESKIKSQGKIDLMFVPINGRDGKRYRANIIGNMDFREAVDLAGAVKPGLVIPGHYEMFESNSENPMQFADYMEAKYPEQNFQICRHGVRTVYRLSDQEMHGRTDALAVWSSNFELEEMDKTQDRTIHQEDRLTGYRKVN